MKKDKKKDIFEEAIDNMLDNEDLAILMNAGCEIETVSKRNEDGSVSIVFKSKYPVFIKRDKNGVPISVHELRT